MNAVKENVFSSEAEEGERMKGICKTDKEFIVGQLFDRTTNGIGVNTIGIGVNNRQRWTFRTRVDGNVTLKYRNIHICITRDKFFKDWKIIEKAEG